MITVCGPRVTLEDLYDIEPVAPENAGRRWRPIQHGELATTIKEEVATRGWHVAEEMYSTARDGADMAGALLLTNVRGVAAVPAGMTLAVGFINSNARRKALQITVGARVLCCTNGLCTGNIILSQVHDHSFDLIDAVEGAVDRYAEAAGGVTAEVDRLRATEISPAEASEILMEAGRRELVGWAALGRVDREYRHPTFAEHGKGTAWALLNAFTYTTRTSLNPMRQMAAYDAFRCLLPHGVASLN